MTRPVDHVLERLAGVTVTNGGWEALCPAHDDQNSSLSITEGNDGRVLITCFAGCKREEIVAALGLGWSDLFPDTENSHRRGGESHIPSKAGATVQRGGLRCD